MLIYNTQKLWDNAAGVDRISLSEDTMVMDRTRIALRRQLMSFAARYRWTVAVSNACLQ